MTARSLRHSTGKHYPDSTLPPAPSRTLPRWLDWIDGTDPGLMRLRMAAEIVIAIGFVLLAEWIFVRATGALQAPIPPKTPPAVAGQLGMLNHSLLVIAMMLGAILAMMSGFGASMFAEARAQAITLLILPLPLLAGLALGLTLHVRLASLASLAVVLAIGTYCRRFGPRGFNGGVLGFLGVFLGFFIQDYVSLPDYGWLAAEIGLATGVMFAVHFVFFLPRPGAAVRAVQRSYVARARDVASEMADVFAATVRAGEGALSKDNERRERRLQQHLLRLNEAALLIDARLENPAALPAGWSGATLHLRLFDAEVGLSNVARFALTLAKRGLPATITATIGRALDGIRAANFAQVADSAAAIRELLESRHPELSALTPTDRVLLHRFATSVMETSTALQAFRMYPAGQAPDDAPHEVFRTPVATSGGWLPGSSSVAGTASQERGGKGLIERIDRKSVV